MVVPFRKLSTKKKAILTSKIDQLIITIGISHAVKAQGGRLMGKDIQKYIQETFDVNYCVRNIYRLMKGLGIVWITSRSMHPKQDPAAQESFKKNCN